jgi:hypothetical protein
MFGSWQTPLKRYPLLSEARGLALIQQGLVPAAFCFAVHPSRAGAAAQAARIPGLLAGPLIGDAHWVSNSPRVAEVEGHGRWRGICVSIGAPASAEELADFETDVLAGFGIKGTALKTGWRYIHARSRPDYGRRFRGPVDRDPALPALHRHQGAQP